MSILEKKLDFSQHEGICIPSCLITYNIFQDLASLFICCYMPVWKYTNTVIVMIKLTTSEALINLHFKKY